MQKPVLQALLVADHIYEDKATNKKVIAGVFHNLLVADANLLQKKSVDKNGDSQTTIFGGMDSGSPYVYVSLTEIYDDCSFKLRFVNVGEGVPLLETGFNIKCDDPLKTVEVHCAVPRLPITKPGTYAMELLYDDELLGMFRIVASKLLGSNEGDIDD